MISVAAVYDRRIKSSDAHRAPLQLQKHDVNIHQASGGMTKGARQPPDDFHSEVLPKFDRRFVGRDHKVELHCPKTDPLRFIQTMFSHRATNPLPASALCDDECCVRHVRAAAHLVWVQSVTSDDFAALFGNENVSTPLKPIS